MLYRKSEKYLAGSCLLVGGIILCLYNFAVFIWDFWYLRPTPRVLLRLYNSLVDVKSFSGVYSIAYCEGGLLVALLMGLVFVLLCIGLYREKSTLISVGSAVGVFVRVLISFGVFYHLRSHIENDAKWFQDDYIRELIFPMHLCFALFFLLLFLASRKKKTAKRSAS